MIMLLCMGVAGCEKNNGDTSSENENTFDLLYCKESIAGKWQLEYSQDDTNYDSPEIIDYSKHNIVFNFSSNNKLTVSGYVDFLQEGEHTYYYYYGKPEINPLAIPSPNLRIDGYLEKEVWTESLSMWCTGNQQGDKISISPNAYEQWKKSYIFKFLSND
jgi:hypothetical protein